MRGRGRGRDGGRPAKVARYEGKKTVFEDSDDEEEKEQDEGMEEGGEEKKDDAPEKVVKEGKKNLIFLCIFIITKQL